MPSQFLSLVVSTLVLAQARIAVGLAWRGPEPTPSDLADEKAHLGFTPRPTNGPSLFNDARGDLKLLRRSLGENICGYESAAASGALTCSPDRTCYFFTVTNIWGMAGCCAGSDFLNCGWALDCVDSRAYSASSCDSSCRSDPFTRKCTNAASPYCQTFKYPDVGVMDYDCGTDSASTYRTMRTSYAGQVGLSYNFNFASLTLSDYHGSSRTGISSATPARATTSASGRKSSAPVAAIVGAVIGGLLVLSLAIGGVLFYLLCMKRRRNQPASLTQGASHGGPPHQVSGTGYEPVQQYAPPTVQSPPPQYYAPVPEKVNPSPQAQELHSQSWYGGPLVAPQGQHQQHPDSITSPLTNQAVSPESTLAGHNQPSYISVPSVDSPELQAQSASEMPPSFMNDNGGPIYEVPANQARS
ncbi:MAG: hypothetical protein M1816_007722 [Peltula sp. TS41687]|nr:MAG: hypothetical protein M1816_007722 [Peltula sp. TS41687]